MPRAKWEIVFLERWVRQQGTRELKAALDWHPILTSPSGGIRDEVYDFLRTNSYGDVLPGVRIPHRIKGLGKKGASLSPGGQPRDRRGFVVESPAPEECANAIVSAAIEDLKNRLIRMCKFRWRLERPAKELERRLAELEAKRKAEGKDD